MEQLNRRSFISSLLSIPLFKYFKFKKEPSFQDSFDRSNSSLGPNWNFISDKQRKFFELSEKLSIYSGGYAPRTTSRITNLHIPTGYQNDSNKRTT